jgi:hypothetical protein
MLQRDLSELPGIFIPCEDLQALKKLVTELYDKKVLSEESIKCVNCPDNIHEILNTPDYFKIIEICGVQLLKGKLDSITRDTDYLL